MGSNYRKIGDFIRLVDTRNKGLRVKKLVGLTVNKQFIPSVANIVGSDMENYKIIKRGQFACSLMQVRRDKKIPVALLREFDEAIISQAYPVFEVVDENILAPEYLMMWFSRSEFDREACFYAVGGVRGSLEWEDFCNMKLPIPPIEKQREIVAEYQAVQKRIQLNEQLIQKLEETAQAVYRRWFVEFEFPDEDGKPYKSSGGEMVWCEELGKEVPEGWEVKQIGEVSELINRGITPSYSENEGLVILNQKCIRNNSIDTSFAKKHNLNKKKVPSEKLLEKYDILVNSTGDGTLGRVGLVKEEVPMTVDSHITILRVNKNFNALFVWGDISRRTEEIAHLAEGSTGQTELSRNKLAEMSILVPDFIEQKKFANILSQKIDYSFILEKENKQLTQLKELLLSKLATV